MSFFRGWKKGMAAFASKLTVIINTALLLFVYIVAVGPTAIVARIFGKKFLKTKLEKNSYWNKLDLKKEKMEAYYRQF